MVVWVYGTNIINGYTQTINMVSRIATIFNSLKHIANNIDYMNMNTIQGYAIINYITNTLPIIQVFKRKETPPTDSEMIAYVSVE